MAERLELMHNTFQNFNTNNMSLNNSFIVKCSCCNCEKKVEIAFEADAGILNLSNFKIGDKLLPDNLDGIKGTIAPTKEIVDEKIDFWVYGVGECPKCKFENWAKIIFRKGIFDSIKQISMPDNPFFWKKL